MGSPEFDGFVPAWVVPAVGGAGRAKKLLCLRTPKPARKVEKDEPTMQLLTQQVPQYFEEREQGDVKRNVFSATS